MSKIAFIFPGQGAQYVGMGKDLYESFPAAREAFLEANDILGFDAAKLCFEGPAEELTATRNSQPAILAASIAALRAFQSSKGRGIIPSACAGLSLGEYSALVASGCISFKDALGLVRKRGEFMEEASLENPGKMAAIIGPAVGPLEDVTKNTGCEVANLNCPGQVIISGSVEAVDKAMEAAKTSLKAKCVPLAVRGPFHSSLMTKASRRLKDELAKTRPNKPQIPFVSNVTAAYADDADLIKNNLALQVNHRVLWDASIRLMMKDGILEYYEIGPGNVLNGLLKKIDKNLIVRNIDKLSDLE